MKESRLPFRLATALVLVLLLPLGLGAVPGPLPVLEPHWDSLPAADLGGIQKAFSSALKEVAADLGLAGEVPLLSANLEDGERPPEVIRVAFGVNGSSDYSANFLVVDNTGDWGKNRVVRFTEVGPSLHLEFARAMEALQRKGAGEATAAPPRLLDTFSPSEILGVDFGVSGGASVFPYSLAARKDGSLVSALLMAVLEFGPSWEVKAQYGKALAGEGFSYYATGVSVSPSGTLILRNSDGTGTYSLPEGSSVYQRLRIDAPAGSSFGVLEDGSPFFLAMAPKLARIYGSEGPRDIPIAKDNYISVAAPGPENTLWLFDPQASAIRILDARGFMLRDLLYLDLEGGSIMKLLVLPDSSFLALTQSDVRRYDRTGQLLWAWDGKAEGLALSLSPMTDIARTGEGIYCLNDLSGKRILRIAEHGAPLTPTLARIQASYLDSTRPGKAQAQAILDLAKAYEDGGGLEAARACLGRYLELKPADQAVAEHRLELEAGLISARAAAGETEVLALLSKFGPERARLSYMSTMKTLETLRALVPDDPEASRRIALLKRAFKDAEDGTALPPALPKIAKIELGPLFPALIQVYISQSPGRLTLRNTLGSAITELRAEVFIPKYMDYPTEGPALASLAPGQEASLDLLVHLNQRVLEVEEDLPLQALVTLRYKEGGQERKVEATKAFTLHRRSALTWDDTGHLAPFITPNDESLAAAAAGMLRGAPESALPSPALARATALCDALGALPLAYVPDPQSPITDTLGDGRIVDTVRFPRTTLAWQGGDCDDTTALLCSLLESQGLGTAILTSPGHVFLAFDTGEAPDSAWLFAAPGYETIVAAGKLWIPLESTNLGEGFAGAWKLASGLVARYRGTRDLAVLPLAALRKTYPALPLPPSGLPLPRPDAAQRASLAALTMARFAKEVSGPVLAGLDRGRQGGTGLEWERASNKMARAQAWYGQGAAAMATLAALVEKSPAFMPAYLNLAILSAKAGRPEEAAAWLARASKAVPGSPAPAEYATRLGLDKAGPAQGTETAVLGSPRTEAGTGGRAGLDSGPGWAY